MKLGLYINKGWRIAVLTAENPPGEWTPEDGQSPTVIYNEQSTGEPVELAIERPTALIRMRDGLDGGYEFWFDAFGPVGRGGDPDRASRRIVGPGIVIGPFGKIEALPIGR